MLVKDLIKELQKIPEDANITIDGFDNNDAHIAVKYYDYDKDLWEKVWCQEEEIDFFIENRDKFPEKVRFRLCENDEDRHRWHNEE